MARQAFALRRHCKRRAAGRAARRLGREAALSIQAMDAMMINVMFTVVIKFIFQKQFAKKACQGLSGCKKWQA